MTHFHAALLAAVSFGLCPGHVTSPPVGSRRSLAPVAELSEEAIAARIASLRASKRRAPRRVREASKPVQSMEPLTLPGDSSSDVPVWSVPDELRMPGAPAAQRHGFHVSLRDIFPGSGLDEAWDTNGELRTALRRALRVDMFKPPAHWSEKQAHRTTSQRAAFSLPHMSLLHSGACSDGSQRCLHGLVAST